MWRDAGLVAGKDLRIEMRSRVATNQVAPFAVLVLVLFGLALDPDSGSLTKAAPGLKACAADALQKLLEGDRVGELLLDRAARCGARDRRAARTHDGAADHRGARYGDGH